MGLIRQRDKEKLRFSGRRHSKRGIVSAGMGIVVLIGFFIISIISGSMKGQGGELLGALGLGLFVIAVFGAFLSYKSFYERDIYYRFPIIGGVLNGLMTLIFVTLYILGAFL